MTRVRMRNDRLIEMSDCTVYLLVKRTKTRLTTVMTRVRMRKRRDSLRCLTVLYSTIYLQVKCTKTRLTTAMTRVRMRNDRLIEMSDSVQYTCW